jgi:glycosyltransferase involved in cell wall biosynthesis
MKIPIGITARNEAANILALLKSLRVSVARATEQLGVEYEFHVLLNDNTDNTPDLLAGQPDLYLWQTLGGLVEAQRALVEASPGVPFVIFTDADILLHPDTITGLTAALQSQPEVQIAYAEKVPIPPRRRTPLARALYFYNLREGYQTRRNYCNGQCFAIRQWNIPTADELHWDITADNPFLNLAAGIRTDDIYLSRDVLRRHGPAGFACVPAAVKYRPPETLRGMFRKYQRMRLEIERLHYYFPDSRETHTRLGRRRLDLSHLRQAPLSEQVYYGVFQAALVLCKLAWHAQRLYYTYVSKTPCPTWLPVTETKEPLE